MVASRAKVQAALRREAKKLDSLHRGVHAFAPIFASDDLGCNWVASFYARGSSASLDQMRQALKRVQAKLPMVDFGRPDGD